MDKGYDIWRSFSGRGTWKMENLMTKVVRYYTHCLQRRGRWAESFVILFLCAEIAGYHGVHGRHTVQDCIWRTSISSSLPELQEAEPRSSCDHGEVWWYYPHGALKTHFENQGASQEFTLCLHGNVTDLSHNITDVTGDNYQRLITTLDDGDPLCLPSKRGNLDLLFDAPESKRHVTVIKFSKKPP